MTFVFLLNSILLFYCAHALVIELIQSNCYFFSQKSYKIFTVCIKLTVNVITHCLSVSSINF